MADRKGIVLSRGRRRLVTLALGAPLLGPLAALAQTTEKPRRIGILAPQPANAPNNIGAFLQGLRELGWVEGRNLVIERRYADGYEDRLPALADELLKLNVEVLVAPGPSATRAARDATRTVPIVMGTHDPVEQGLIASLAQPGGNVTGWCILSTDLADKQMSLLKEAIPRLARVAVVANPRMAAHSVRMDYVAKAARTVGLEFLAVEAADADGLAPAFAKMRAARVEAFYVLPDPQLDRLRTPLVNLAAEHRLPGMYPWRFYVDAGGLMSYGASLPVQVRLWATYVDKILKGARPGELPVETPRKYELVLNQRAARSLGFTFPSALLLAADEVIS